MAAAGKRLGVELSQLVEQAVEARRRTDVDRRDLSFLTLSSRIARQPETRRPSDSARPPGHDRVDALEVHQSCSTTSCHPG